MKVEFDFKLKFWQDKPLLATALQITIFALLLLALIFCLVTVGVFGNQWRRFDDIVSNDDSCFLYVFEDSEGELQFGDNSACNFVASAHGIIAVALMILIVLLAVIVFLRLSFGFDMAVFIAVAVITFSFSLIASIVLTFGFAVSCGAVSPIECQLAAGETLFGALKSSTACSWIETLLIGAVMVISCIYKGIISTKHGMILP